MYPAKTATYWNSCYAFSSFDNSNDLTLKLNTANHLVSQESPALCQLPLHLTPDSVKRVIELIDGSKLCIGNSEEKFIELARKKKGKFLSISGEPVAYFEEGVCFKTASGEERCATIRRKDCLLLLLRSEICSVCERYHDTLRTMLYREKNLFREVHMQK